MKQGWLELSTLGDLLVRGATLQPDREVLVLLNERYTYSELHERASRSARSLSALGISKGDHVGILMHNSIEFLELIFAVSYLGAIVVPLNARFQARELAHVIADAQLRAILTTSAFDEHVNFVTRLYQALPGLEDADADAVGLAVATAPDLRFVVALGPGRKAGTVGVKTFAEAAETTSPGIPEQTRWRVAIRDVAMMFYTSGSTAMPKGCPLSHEAITRIGALTADRYGFRDGDRAWAPAPMFHTACTQPLVSTLQSRGTFVTMSHFEPAAALQQIESERITLLFPFVPTITQALLGDPGYRTDSFRSVRVVGNLGTVDFLRQCQARMPHSVQVASYGLTEFAGAVTVSSPADTIDDRLTTQGRAIPGHEIQIRDAESAVVCGPGQPGEIVMRGPTMCFGYHRDDAKSRQTIEPDGWFHTGDLGKLDDRGQLVFLGRTKDMLKVGGENVAAVEIEAYLEAHPQVSIAQVVGIPNAKYIEVPAAFVELRPGSVVTPDELIDYCAAGMARFKVPRHVIIMSDWPISATKISKMKLRDQLIEQLEL
jgi:fatty-acyl-CoA synthase